MPVNLTSIQLPETEADVSDVVCSFLLVAMFIRHGAIDAAFPFTRKIYRLYYELLAADA